MAVINKTKAERKKRQYVLRQYMLKEGLIGSGISPKDVEVLEDIINTQCERGYKVTQMNTTSIDSKGLGGGDRTLFLILFEKIDDDSESDSN